MNNKNALIFGSVILFVLIIVTLLLYVEHTPEPRPLIQNPKINVR